LLVLILSFFSLLIIRHTELEEAARDSLSFAARSLIPALFPFAVLSRFVLTASLLPCRDKLSQTVAKALHLQASVLPAYCLGLFCGFPIGAYAAASLWEAVLCDGRYAQRSASLANNASAAFLFGTAASLFGNSRAAVILFVSQTTATLLVSVLSNKNSHVEQPTVMLSESPSYLSLAADAVSKAGLAMLSLSAFVVFFAVLTKALLFAGVPEWVTLFLEPTSAVRYAANLAPQIGLPLSLSFASLALGWSGLSVILQAQALFKGTLPLSLQIPCRAAIALVSFTITFLFSFLFLN